jgi:serine/threonine protein kinase
MTTATSIGKYAIVREIAQGGFGRTLLAEDSEGRRVVLKQFCPQHYNVGSQALRLFDQECDRLKTVGTHEQIPSFIEYFEEGEDRFIVQEFIDGQTLKDELRESGSFSEKQIIALLKDILPVIGFIHHKQVIHRDIKPENIIRRSSDSKLFLVDFGASKPVSDTVLAKTGTMIGSPLFVAPEQSRGKATYASDIYSLGLTCAHLLTNVSPFDLVDESDSWVWQDYCSQTIAEDLALIINTMLHRGLRDRYSSAPEVLLAISAIEEKRKEVEGEQATNIAKSETQLPSRFKRNTIAILVATAFATTGIAIWRVNNSVYSNTPPAVEQPSDQRPKGFRFPLLDDMRDELAADKSLPKEMIGTIDLMVLLVKFMSSLMIISGFLGMFLKLSRWGSREGL